MSNSFINNLIHPTTHCTHTVFCSRTAFCSEICKPGTVATSSWQQFASRTQSSLSTLSTLCEHQSIGTHNSAITAAYGYGVEDTFYSLLLSASYLQFNQVRTLSQYYSITDQLNMGVRQIELDIHYFHNQLRISHCGFSVGLINYLFYTMEFTLRPFHFLYDTETIGCMPSFNGIPSEDQLLVQPVLEEIVMWLQEKRNRDEFVILYLDLSSNLKRWKQEEQLVKLVEASFSSLLMESNSTKPLFQQIRENHRVMVVTRRALNTPSSHFFNTNAAETCGWQEQDIKRFCFADGTVRRDSESFAGKTDKQGIFYSRVVTNQLRYGPLSKDFLPLPSPVNLYSANVHSLYGLGVNSLATDYLSNEQIKEHFWLWKESLDVDSLSSHFSEWCVLMKPGERWSVAPCSETHSVLCQKEKDHEVFVIGGKLSNPQLFIPLYHEQSEYFNSFPHGVEHTSACPEGYAFKPPIHLRQLGFAQEVVVERNESVWIGFRLEEYYFVWIVCWI